MNIKFHQNIVEDKGVMVLYVIVTNIYPQTLGWCSHFLADCSLSGENVLNQLYLLVVCYKGAIDPTTK